MREAFLQYLLDQGVVEPATLSGLRGAMRMAPEPIGSIAFSFGLLGPGDVELVLDAQRRDYAPFGEIAIREGLLTREQVTQLLYVQQVRAAAGLAEALTLTGHGDLAETMRLFASFLLERAPELNTESRTAPHRG